MRRRLSLGTLLTAVNVALVAAAVLSVVVVAAGLLRRLAEEQALARVGIAGATVAAAVERAGDDLAATTHLLAERPILARLLDDRDFAGLQAYLDGFRGSSRLSGCAVLLEGAVLARSGGPSDWQGLARTGREGRAWFAGVAPGGAPLLGAWAPIPGRARGGVVATLLLDDRLVRAPSTPSGLRVAVLERGQALSQDSPLANLRAMALESTDPVAQRVDDAGAYVSLRPLRGPGGEVTGLVETTLPTAAAPPAQQRFVRSLLLIALFVGGLATLASVLVGRRLVRPLEALTAASARIGLGDLSTPIPRAPGAEIGTLASTMEEMRGHLLHLTAELRHRQAEAEAILAGIVEGVFSVDRERRIRYLNAQAAAVLGVRPEDAIGRFCGDVLNPQGPGGIRPCEERCPIVHARFRGRARATEDLLLASGDRKSVVITSAPFAGEPAETPGAYPATGTARQVQVIRDETESEATRRLRDTVLANITHEFRTPLSAQLASIELLRDRLGELKPEEARDLVLALQRGTLRLTQLVDNLLESVRIDAGHDSIRRQPVALDEVVDEAVDLASPLLALRDQKLHVDLPYPLPGVTGDAPRLVQVFVNLLANANKFAPAGSAIGIGGELSDGRVTLWVEDEGPGLSPEAGDRLFERFMRSAGEEPKESGMGLGLFIVKSIVERHGGRVEARGRVAGVAGTRMCVILPKGPEA